MVQRMRHGLRPIRADDRELLLSIYASTRADELALTDWSDAQRRAFVEMQFDAQSRHYALQRPLSLCHLIVLDDGPSGGPAVGHAVGRLWVDRGADSVHVLDISLLPEARGKGIGTALLRQLMAEARQLGKPLTISVEIHNPARRLYERLGFEPQGEVQGIYQRMAWQPATQRQLEHQE